MILKKLSVLICFLFLIILSLGNISAAGCVIVREENCGYNIVMGLSDTDNAHGELADSISYDYVLCCDFGWGDTTCSLTLDPDTNQPINKIIGLSSSTNAHAEVPDLVSPDYNTYNVCYDSVKECASTIYDCALGEIFTTITLSSNTNAHIGGNTKICCKPQCELTSAYWSIDGSTPIEEGTNVIMDNFPVYLIVEGTNCDGQTISFKVWEHDDNGDDPITSGNPENITFNGNTVTQTWTAEWQDDSDGDGNPPEYYFTASVVDNLETIESEKSAGDLLSVIKLPIGYCSDINFCSDYLEEENFCNADVCDVSESDSNCNPDIGPCTCEWDSEANPPSCDFVQVQPGGVCGDSEVQRPNAGGMDEQCDPDLGIPVFLSSEDSCVKLTNHPFWQMDTYTEGSLDCTSGCTFDITGCIGSPPICGDNVVNQIGEVCDGRDLNGWTCGTLGYGGGTLSCSGCEFDKSGCTNPGDKICGDGVVQQPNDGNINEQCDGANLDGKAPDCSTIDDYTDGTLTCHSNCLFDYTECIGSTPICGDDVINVFGEDCDVNDLRGKTCEFFGYDEGSLSCSSACKFDASLCIGVPGGGKCKYAEETDDDCEDGFLTYSWTVTWETESEAPQPDWCVNGGGRIPCPAQLQLPFFGFYNIIAVLLLITLIYVVLILRKN